MNRQSLSAFRPNHMRRLVACLFPVLLLSASIGQVPGQTQQPTDASVPPDASGTPQEASSPEDRFLGLRENADRLKAIYTKTDTAKMKEVEILLKNRACQINRIGGDLDRTIEALHQWIEAELVYWQKWNEAEQQRVDGMTKSLESMQLDQQRIEELIKTETNEHEVLLHKKADLEQTGERAPAITQEIDTLVLQIQDSENDLAKAKRQYDDVTARVNTMQTEITARVIFMREQINHTEAYGLQFKSFYEDERKKAQEVCNTKRPGASRIPLPGTSKPAPQSQP